MNRVLFTIRVKPDTKATLEEIKKKNPDVFWDFLLQKVIDAFPINNIPEKVVKKKHKVIEEPVEPVEPEIIVPDLVRPDIMTSNAAHFIRID